MWTLQTCFLWFFFLFPIRDGLKNAVKHRSVGRSPASWCINLSSLVDLGKAQEETYCSSLNLCSGLFFRLLSFVLHFIWVCTTATETQNTPLPGLCAGFELEVSKYDLSKHLQLWTAHNGECSCVINKIPSSGIAQNLACPGRGLPTGSCSLPRTVWYLSLFITPEQLNVVWCNFCGHMGL